MTTFPFYSLQVFLSPRTSSRCAKRSWAASSGCLCMFTSITSTASAVWVQRPTSIPATSTTTSSSPSSTSLITLNWSPWWDVCVTSDVWGWREGAVERGLDGCFVLREAVSITLITVNPAENSSHPATCSLRLCHLRVSVYSLGSPQENNINFLRLLKPHRLHDHSRCGQTTHELCSP